MRIIHTSDWHLGQHFMGQSRQAEHSALIDWLLEQVAAQAADAVLIAGDIFDTGAPPSYARALYNRLVARLHQAGVALLVLGGNHDSVAVLEESQGLLQALGTQVIAATGAAEQHVRILPLRDGTPGCIVCALPFIRPRDVLQSQAEQSAQDKQLALQQAIQATYQQVYAAALHQQAALQASLGRQLPIIATGHLTTVGASSSESVREIYVGALEAFPTQAFPPVDYIALGHIHQPQTVGGLAHIRYSGSPIALGFDEARQTKQMLLVELGAPGLQSVTALPVPVFQPMMALRSSLAALPAALKQATALAQADKKVWLDITIEEDDYLADLPLRVQALADGLPLQLLRVKRLRGRAAAQWSGPAAEALDALSPAQVFERRLALETMDAELQQALTTRYQSVLQSLVNPSGEPL
ncbi:exonuclease subunit SbcD [uncultured Comamonas sp.]|uniref:exonuclease subunit SbcD n=1 Tax=uncultured Comamonas sp. TaxID=114710 RepID=UPI00374A940F